MKKFFAIGFVCLSAFVSLDLSAQIPGRPKSPVVDQDQNIKSELMVDLESKIPTNEELQNLVIDLDDQDAEQTEVDETTDAALRNSMGRNCPERMFCIYSEPNLQGHVSMAPRGTGGFIAGPVKGRTASAWNRTGFRQCLYRADGRMYVLKKFTKVMLFGPNFFNRIISSTPC